jgi:hypothetical protein
MSQGSDDQKIRALLAQLKEQEAQNDRYKATLKELRKPVRHHLEAMGAFFEIEEKKIEFYCKQLELSGKI